MGVYEGAKTSINKAVDENLEKAGVSKLKTEAEGLTEGIRSHEAQAKYSYDKIIEYETEANEILSSISFKTIIGTIVPYGGEIEETKPGDPCEVREGWYFCNGALLKCSDFPQLYAVIGTAFGAPDSDTFNLPDLRGRFVRGVDHGTGRDPDANKRLSERGVIMGNKVGSVQEDAFKKHAHGFEDWTSAVGPGGEHPGAGGGTIPNRKTYIAGNSDETRPKNIYVNWIIKAK